MAYRTSTMSFYDNAVSEFNGLQEAIANSLRRISTGKQLLSPAENPSAASQVLITKQASALNTQYAVNRGNANTALSTADGVLGSVTNLMNSLSARIVEAGNGTLSPADKATMAQQFQNELDQLMTLANSKDANGNYLFSGTATNIAPYSVGSNGGQYNGNQIAQFLQANTSQQIPITVAGNSIFGNIQVSPNAYFGTANANNASAATISSGTVVNASAVTNDNYAITFTSSTSYDVVDTSTGAVISTGNPYTSGAPITVGGVQFTVTDGAPPNAAPAAGDQFAVQPGNQNIFQVITNVITALKQPMNTPQDQTNFANSIAQANNSIKASLNNVVAVRGQLGNSLQQVASLNDVGDVVGLSYQSAIDSLEGVDLAQEISELAQRQIAYEAAQQAFIKTTQSIGLINKLP